MEPARCEGNPPTCTCGRAPGTASVCWDCCWRSTQLGSSLPWEASCQEERAQPQQWSSAARSWWWLRSREKSGAGSKPSQPLGQTGLEDIASQHAGCKGSCSSHTVPGDFAACRRTRLDRHKGRRWPLASSTYTDRPDPANNRTQFRAGIAPQTTFLIFLLHEILQ